MRSVVLSTTAAEYIIQLLKTMNVNVEMPITIYVDIVGALWLPNNRTTSERTKHVHIRTAIVKESRGRKNIDQICEVRRK